MGTLLFLSGQGRFDTTSDLVGDTLTGGMGQTFRDLEEVAISAGPSLAHGVRVGVYVYTLNCLDEFDEIMAEFASCPVPNRTTVPADPRRFDIEFDAAPAVLQDTQPCTTSPPEEFDGALSRERLVISAGPCALPIGHRNASVIGNAPEPCLQLL